MEPSTRTVLSNEKHLYNIYKVSWGHLGGQLCVLSDVDQSQKLNVIISVIEIV